MLRFSLSFRPFFLVLFLFIYYYYKYDSHLWTAEFYSIYIWNKFAFEMSKSIVVLTFQQERNQNEKLSIHLRFFLYFNIQSQECHPILMKWREEKRRRTKQHYNKWNKVSKEEKFSKTQWNKANKQINIVEIVNKYLFTIEKKEELAFIYLYTYIE